jgi:hypothetical protein
MKQKYAIIICGMLLASMIIYSVAAVTVTAPVTDMTRNKVTFNRIGGTQPCWYSWGVGTNYYWTTPNLTVCGSDTQTSAPMLTGETYNVRACDTDGCAAAVSFTVNESRMIPRTNYGSGVVSIWRSGFNVTQASSAILDPYVASLSTVYADASIAFIIGILFFFIFVGYWLRTGSFLIPAILGLVAGGIIVGAGGIGANMPSEFRQVAYVLMIIGFAGIFLSWVTNK